MASDKYPECDPSLPEPMQTDCDELREMVEGGSLEVPDCDLGGDRNCETWFCDNCEQEYMGDEVDSVSFSHVVDKDRHPGEVTLRTAYCQYCALLCPECNMSLIFVEEPSQSYDQNKCEICYQLICSDCSAEHRARCVQVSVGQ
jgi:hypothetical protein